MTDDMIQLAVLITAAVFVVALVYLGWATWLTSRRDRRWLRDATRNRP